MLRRVEIGVGTGGLPLPLPPNRTGDFLASGSPVSGARVEHWLFAPGLRLRRLTRVRRKRRLVPPPFPLSRVANRRSVHNPSSVHSHIGGTSLPCLAKGTPGSLICSCVSLTLPPSCPPSLHGRYPLLRYYEDSDSCPAPFRTRTGILGSRTRASGHSVSTHQMRPCDGYALAPPQAWPPTRLGGYRRFFGLRSFPAVSSVASSRIEFVLWTAIGSISLRTIHSLSVALHLTSW